MGECGSVRPLASSCIQMGESINQQSTLGGILFISSWWPKQAGPECQRTWIMKHKTLPQKPTSLTGRGTLEAHIISGVTGVPR